MCAICHVNAVEEFEPADKQTSHKKELIFPIYLLCDLKLGRG